MKAIVFTLDAIFALVIASISISLLLYFHYISPTAYSTTSFKAYNILSTLSSSKMGTIDYPLIQSMEYQLAGSNETWGQFMSDSYNNGGNQHGPLYPIISFNYTAVAAITSPAVAGYGRIYFAAGNTLYALNSTTGTLSWSKNVKTNIESSPILYSGLLIFANLTNLTAVNPVFGSVVWSTNSITTLVPITSQLLGYGGKIYFGADTRLFAYYSDNGTMAWSNNTGTNPVSLSGLAGSIVLKTSSNNIDVITGTGVTGKQLWSKSIPSTSSISNLVSFGDVFAYGEGSYANATYVDGSSAFSISTSSSIEGVSKYGSMLVYQGSSYVLAVSPSGYEMWSFSAPSFLGTAITNTTPAISSGMVYTLWSNNYLLAQNASNGKVMWFVHLPGTPSPHLSIAYGKLFVVVGNQLLAYGSCPITSSASPLENIAYLYVNGKNSCADAIAYTFYPMHNYSILINNTLAPDTKFASFSGTNVYLNLSNSSSVESDGYSWSIWLYPNAWVNNTIIMGEPCTAPGCPYIMEKLNATAPYRVMFTVNGTAPGYTVYAPLSINKWTNVIATYSYINGRVSIYINGHLVSSVAKPKNVLARYIQPVYVGSVPSSSNYYSGYLSNVQVYNITLTAQQAFEVFLSGAGGSPLANISAWYPLSGDFNNYIYPFIPAYATNVKFASINYNPTSLSNAFIVSRSSVNMPVLNLTTGKISSYNIGVISWR